MNGPSRRARLDGIAEIAQSIRESPIEVPDFTSSILDRVDVERPFLAPSVRRRLPWVRIGLVTCAALGTLAIALTHRWAPEAVQLSEQPAPITDVVQSIECATCRKLGEFRPSVLAVTEKDASRFFAAVVTAAHAAENEGRRPNAEAPAPITIAAILPQSQAVGLDLPAPPTSSRVILARSTTQLRGPLGTAQSVIGESGGPVLMMSTDAFKPRGLPTLIEHELDGFATPR